jgi:[glutamine synthetase] adenylyltransferase / [glutamine synthetase]-adenylyl-L-tyrosine phosphorylase
MADVRQRNLSELISEAPIAYDGTRAAVAMAELVDRCRDDQSLAHLQTLLTAERVQRLLNGVFGCSPYLTSLVRRDPAGLMRILASVPEPCFTELCEQLAESLAGAHSMAEAMRGLRVFKTEVALLTALCDLGGVWPVMTVTRVLTQAADAALAAAVGFLFRQSSRKGEWLPIDTARPEVGSAYFVLGMGKYGSFELNYSSDIDLIVFYDTARARLRDDIEVQRFFVRLTRDLVRLMQERTGDGYVFRTDLRLRPDPGATPIALSTDAALQYYESFGQNWERAALIKARAVAGDLRAGRDFLGALSPFIWRKYLDFAAIADIHAMKRQIHAYRGFASIGVAGHNIKLGRGGIREIEFFVQTQQLIAGGRQRDLRVPATLDALGCLTRRGWITPAVQGELDVAYRFLRRVEHRLQMISDEQTQTLPEEPDKLARVASFSGFAETKDFAAALTAELERVQRHYARLFEDSPALTRGGANMVFAGEADDPDTVAALTEIGFSRPSEVIAMIRGWHHGRYPAVRSTRARERLTEVQPVLLEALGKSADPDLAFVNFDRFLSQLPSGVQLFSLLRRNPSLLELIAAIMGSAPRLARILSRRRRVLDAVLDPGFFGSLPDRPSLTELIASDLAQARDFQECLDRARIIGSEQAFLIGVRLLTGTIMAGRAGSAYALLAERMIEALQLAVEAEMVKAHGKIADGGAVIVAMGKLGGREMTAASDLDLILVYDHDPEATQSDGPRPLPPSQYYARSTQRLISALTAQTAEGNLYEVDMRLRPSGQKGPVATHLASFTDYQAREAWTWEHMALTRARVISGPQALRAKVERAIHNVLVRSRGRATIANDVHSMRSRIAKEKGTSDIWDLKQVRGGLVDIEFIAQYLQLVHAAQHPDVLDQNTLLALQKLSDRGLLPATAAETLLSRARVMYNLNQILRLCLDARFDPEKAPDGLKELLVRTGEAPDFRRLEAELAMILNDVAALFEVLIV